MYIGQKYGSNMCGRMVYASVTIVIMIDSDVIPLRFDCWETFGLIHLGRYRWVIKMCFFKQGKGLIQYNLMHVLLWGTCERSVPWEDENISDGHQFCCSPNAAVYKAVDRSQRASPLNLWKKPQPQPISSTVNQNICQLAGRRCGVSQNRTFAACCHIIPRNRLYPVGCTGGGWGGGGEKSCTNKRC